VRDEDLFKDEIKVMLKELPEDFASRFSKPDPFSVSYARLRDSLTDRRRMEERVSLAVMGVEGLLLESQGELKYKLRTRAAKVLGLLGYDPDEVSAALGLAYDCRSKYVHGAELGKLDGRIRGKHGGAVKLWEKITEYLRATWLTMKLVGKEKETFIELIDRANIGAKESGSLMGDVLAADVLAAADRLPRLLQGSKKGGRA
jgi:hypothetical protein